MIYVAKLRFKFEPEVAHRLLANVGRPALSWLHPAPAMMRGFAKLGFKFKPPRPALPGCQ
jgi:hypothetical protein